MKTLLTIAGFDPSSGAGITADLSVFASEGFFGTACATALTVQSTVGVQASEPVQPATIAATLECLEADLPAAGIKIGMLATAGNVRATGEYLERVRRERPGIPIVLDAVLRSSSGRELLSAEGVATLSERLLPLVDWVTPNLAELSVLTGRNVETRETIEDAARELQQRYRTLGVIVTGGHLEEHEALSVSDLVLEAQGRGEWIAGERVEGTSTHGTGCAYSSALLCGLARGMEPVEAAQAAQRFVAEAIRHAVPLGQGHGPMNLHWRFGGTS